MNPATQISLTTIRLECFDGSQTSVGTGFLFVYQIKVSNDGVDETLTVPMIITNKHVVRNCTKLTTTLTLIPYESVINDSIAIAEDYYQTVSLDNLHERLIEHPDPEVDIAAFSFHEFIPFIPKEKKIKIVPIDESLLLSPEERVFTRAIESIIMIGYPNGLWDSTNNRPVARKGITASHPLHSWNGERKFLIDAACFPGSSGSPVYQFEDGVVRTGETDISFGSKAKLIGILFAGPLITQEGRIEQRTIPTGTSYVAVTNAMMNLGFVAHADVIKDLIPLIEEIVKRQKSES